MPDQLSCPVHSTAPQDSHGSTTKQLLASDGRTTYSNAATEDFISLNDGLCMLLTHLEQKRSPLCQVISWVHTAWSKSAL